MLLHISLLKNSTLIQKLHNGHSWTCMNLEISFSLLEPAGAHDGMVIWVCIREENGEKNKTQV